MFGFLIINIGHKKDNTKVFISEFGMFLSFF